jgi:ABC-type multidrug transport system fused ATPase/permease subunit
MRKTSVSLIQFFLYFIKVHPISFSIFLLAPSSVILKTNIIPYVLKIIIDTISNYEGDRNNIYNVLSPVLWLGILVWIGFIIIERLQYWWQSHIIPSFESSIRATVSKYILLNNYEYFFNQLSGNITNKIMRISQAMESVRIIICHNVLPAVSVSLIALIMMHSINPVFSLILGAWLIIQLLLILYFIKSINTAAQRNAKDKNNISGILVDIISNINYIKNTFKLL